MKKIITYLLIMFLISASIFYCEKKEVSLSNGNLSKNDESINLDKRIESAYKKCVDTYSEDEKEIYQSEIGKCFLAELNIMDNNEWKKFQTKNNLLDTNYVYFTLVYEISDMLDGNYIAIDENNEPQDDEIYDTSSGEPVTKGFKSNEEVEKYKNELRLEPFYQNLAKDFAEDVVDILAQSYRKKFKYDIVAIDISNEDFDNFNMSDILGEYNNYNSNGYSILIHSNKHTRTIGDNGEKYSPFETIINDTFNTSPYYVIKGGPGRSLFLRHPKAYINYLGDDEYIDTSGRIKKVTSLNSQLKKEVVGYYNKLREEVKDLQIEVHKSIIIDNKLFKNLFKSYEGQYTLYSMDNNKDISLDLKNFTIELSRDKVKMYLIGEEEYAESGRINNLMIGYGKIELSFGNNILLVNLIGDNFLKFNDAGHKYIYKKN